MMLKQKNVLLMVLFVLIIGTVSSLEVKKTEFIITTDPYQNLSIQVVDAETDDELQLFEGRARKFGEYKFTYYGFSKKVKLLASIFNNESGETLKEEEFGPYTLGTPTIKLNFTLSSEIGENNEKKTNEPIESNETTEEEPIETNSPIAGFTIGDLARFSKIYYYVGAGALGVIILIIVLKRGVVRRSDSSPVEPNPKKIKSVKKASKTEVVVPQSVQTHQESVNETEKKIEDLQKQLEQIRNEEKLLKLQKQINQERQSLKTLLDEDNPQQPINNLDNQSKNKII